MTSHPTAAPDNPPTHPGDLAHSAKDGGGRHIGHQLPPADRRHDHRTRAERLADTVTSLFGSWRFIIIQTVIVAAWISANLIALAYRWDPYPFILLNLVFSTQAAYAAPLILLSQNRQANTDRREAEHDYRVNQLALQYLITWHHDQHGQDCQCIQNAQPIAEATLAYLRRDR